MIHKHRSTFLAIIFFIVTTLVMTYPLIFKMGSSVRDLGDPLLNTWILSSNINNISHLNVGGYFDANIFYPHKRTLAYSEHLFTQTLMAFPVSLFSRNPVFVYNFVLLFSFLTSCLGMYFLACYLTKNSLAGIIAGVIYGFSPFMFAHLSHLQIITAGGIPLAFLFLHKFFESESLKNLLLFALFSILQVLANGYYALYLALFAGFYFLFFMFFKQKYKDRRFWLKMIVVLIIFLVCLGPFLKQYVQVSNEMGFSRIIGSHANFKSFLSTPAMNKIYGQLTAPFRKPEGELFPGLMVIFLAAAGCVLGSRRKERENLIFAKPLLIYSIILAASFLFTFGPKGPYILLYKYVPGFSSLRVASRFHIFVMFSLAVLAAFGYKEIAARFFPQKKKSRLWTVLLTLLILLEYLSLPIPLFTISSRKDIPEVYNWLKQRKNIQNLIELPLPRLQEGVGAVECPRIYYSIFHRKNMVNGYSGYFPPLYNELRRRWQSNPLDQNIEDLRNLGVDHILLHSNLYDENEWDNLLIGLSSLKEGLELVTVIEGTYVFRIRSTLQNSMDEATLSKSSLLSNSNWKAEASINSEMAASAIDGDIRTRWQSGPQRRGDFFELNLGRVYSIQGLSLKLGDKQNDFPHGFRVELSTDRISWKNVQEMEMTDLPITAFLKPKELALEVHFPQCEAQYIRITNLGEHQVFYWSIFEIEVLN